MSYRRDADEGESLDQIKVLDRRLMAVAKANSTARLFMTVLSVGVITALSVASSFDDASRFKRSSSAGAYLGQTPRRHESGETSWNGRISKQGSLMTRKHLYEAATTLLTRNLRFSTLKARGLKLAKGVRLQENDDCRGPEDGRDPSYHVEDQYPIPLSQAAA